MPLVARHEGQAGRCHEYEVSVTAGLGGQCSTVQYSTVQYSEDEAKLTFLTLPEAGVAARLQPLVEAGTEDALVRWLWR